MGVRVLDAKVYIAEDDSLNSTTGLDRVLIVDSDTIRLCHQKTPSSSSAAGYPGEVCITDSHIYVCTALDTWKRAALTTF